MEIRYFRNGDYFFPEMGLTEEEQRPIGKYGLMRQEYLQEHRHGLFAHLLLSGKLMEHLHEIDDTCRERLDIMIPQMMRAEGVDERLKADDQMEWVARMNSIKHRAEEMLMTELIYD